MLPLVGILFLGSALAVDTLSVPRRRTITLNMTLRLELFVDNIERTVSFYTDILGFEVQRSDSDYTSLVHGCVVLGIGRARELPADHHFNQVDLARPQKGVGTEIVFEVDDLDSVLARIKRLNWPILVPIRSRSWGVRDFRISDPDGYFLRITEKVDPSRGCTI